MARVLIVSGIWPPDVGGPASHGPEFGEFLTRRGHDVVAVVSSGGRAERAGFPVLEVRRDASLPRRLSAAVPAIHRQARRADVVYATGLYARAALACRSTGTPLVVKLVNDPAYERAKGRGYFLGSLEDFQERATGARVGALRALRRAALGVPHGIVVPSRYLAGFVEAWGVEPQRIHVVENPSPPALPSEPRAAVRQALGMSELPTAVFAGRFVEQKNLPMLVRALNSVPRLRLFLVGDGPERRALETLVAAHALQDRVTFVGPLSRAETLRWMRAADLTVLPSSWENYPHAALESLRVGTPVVGTRVGGVPEIVTDGANGILVAAGDEAGLAGVLRRLTDSPEVLPGLQATAARLPVGIEGDVAYKRIEALVCTAAQIPKAE